MNVRDSIIQIQILKKKAYQLEYQRLQYDSNKEIILLIFAGFFLFIPLFFIPYKLKHKREKMHRLDDQIDHIREEINAINARLNIYPSI